MPASILLAFSSRRSASQTTGLGQSSGWTPPSWSCTTAFGKSRGSRPPDGPRSSRLRCSETNDSGYRSWIRRADVPGQWVVASRLGPGWFDTVRIPFIAGRDFTWQDRTGSPLVAIVNQTLARIFWNGAAIGQQIRYGDRTIEIVGIVRDSKYWTLGEATSPTVYLPFRQNPALYEPTLHVRTSDPRGTAERIRRELQQLVPGSAPQLQLMSDAVAVAVIPARVGALVTGGFGLLGALLATMGVYGLISYIVVQRSREMAIRRAIGAPSAHIVRVVVGGNGMLAALEWYWGLSWER